MGCTYIKFTQAFVATASCAVLCSCKISCAYILKPVSQLVVSAWSPFADCTYTHIMCSPTTVVYTKPSFLLCSTVCCLNTTWQVNCKFQLFVVQKQHMMYKPCQSIKPSHCLIMCRVALVDSKVEAWGGVWAALEDSSNCWPQTMSDLSAQFDLLPFHV